MMRPWRRQSVTLALTNNAVDLVFAADTFARYSDGDADHALADGAALPIWLTFDGRFTGTPPAPASMAICRLW
jgi:hypothetical protein